MQNRTSLFARCCRAEQSREGGAKEKESAEQKAVCSFYAKNLQLGGNQGERLLTPLVIQTMLRKACRMQQKGRAKQCVHDKEQKALDICSCQEVIIQAPVLLQFRSCPNSGGTDGLKYAGEGENLHAELSSEISLFRE